MQLTEVRLLNVRTAGEQRYISAASGLVRINSYMYVVSDDELHMGVFRVSDEARPGDLFRMFEGKLAPSNPERKRQKRDVEALALLPASSKRPHGGLLILGSGSRSSRELGVIIDLAEDGSISGAPKLVSWSHIFSALPQTVGKLNIEGAVVGGGRLVLIQRGNKGDGINAAIHFDLASVLLSLEYTNHPVAPLEVHTYDLGSIQGVPLSFTDVTLGTDHQLIFTAAAEDTKDAYEDGGCLGSAIGLISKNGDLEWVESLELPIKVEGIHAEKQNNNIELLLVTDADNPEIPSKLLRTAIPC